MVFIPRWEKYKDKKPSGLVEVNYANELSANLRHCYFFGTQTNNVDLVTLSNSSLVGANIVTTNDGVVNGASSHINLGTLPVNTFSEISCLLSYKNYVFAAPFGRFFGIQYSGADDIRLYSSSGILTSHFDDGSYTARTFGSIESSAEIVLTHTGSLHSGYKNGKFVSSVSDTYNFVGTNGLTYVGSTPSVSSAYVSATFERFLVFDKALSADEIYTLNENPYQILKPRKTFFTFSTTTSSQTLTATLFTNNNTFYSPSANAGTVSLQPSVFNNTSSFSTPTVTASNSLQAELLTNTQTFYNQTVTTSNTLQADVLSNTNSFYSHTLIEGSVALQPLLFTNNNTVYSSTVVQGTVALQPALVSNENSFLSPTVSTSYTLQSGLLTNTNTFYTQQLSASYALQPTLVSNTSEFYTPAVSTSYTLQADVLTNAQIFYNAIVSNEGSKVLVPERFDNTSLFYTPTLTTGTVSVQPSRFDNTETFYTTTVTSTYPLQTSLYTNTSTFNAHTVSAGTVTLQSDLFVQTNNFYSATVVLGSGTQFIQPTLFENTNAFFSGVVAIEQFIVPSLFTNPNSFNTHAILDASLYKEIVEFNVSFKQLDSRSINIKQFVDFQTEL